MDKQNPKKKIISKFIVKTVNFIKQKFKKINIPDLSNYINNQKKLILISSLLGIIVVFFLGFFFYKANTISLYYVYSDGEEIGTVSDASIVENWVSDQLLEMSERYGLTNLVVKNELTFAEELKFQGKTDESATLEALSTKLVIEAKGIEIIVNGEVVGVVEDTATAERIFNSLKEAVMPNYEKHNLLASAVGEINEETNQSASKLDNIGFKEDIQTKEVGMSPQKIIAEETMLQLLQKGTLEEKTYTVQAGDTISEIAVMYGLTTQQIYQQNPKIKGELIRIGDELNITALTPLVTVETTEIVTQIRPIPFDVAYQKDNSLYENQSKVLIAGIEGKKEVQYTLLKENGRVVSETVLYEKTISEPTTKVVAKGTKRLSEMFIPSIWPTVGTITSSYGYRKDPINGSTSFHNGIDIANKYGTAIYATADGTVTFSGWNSGGYGYEVRIDHGNGYVTYYGHNSKNLVKKGDTVKKGQVIGYMGSTGRSTGPHVDYRISLDGKKINPINYMK